MHEFTTLTQLQQRIKSSLTASFPVPIWVRAEIHELKTNPSGHCYMELVEKGQGRDMFKAKARAMIWASRRPLIESIFYQSTGRRLEAGMAVLVLARVQYSELYSLSLVIEDIDPAYTLGEVEQARQRTIERLQKEGMMDMNRSLPLPALPRRFAVISSETAAGYGDFMHHLHENGYGFRFFTRLYQAPMQGDTAPSGIIAALEAIWADIGSGEKYDAVLLLRGGGAVADLVCFDDYSLAANIAQFPIPVMVAVGHERDTHICDMVAAVSVKTPTAMADYIVEAFIAEDSMIGSLSDRLRTAIDSRMERQRRTLEETGRRLGSGTAMRCRMERNRMDVLLLRMGKGVALAINRESGALDVLQMRVRTAAATRLKAETARLDMLEVRIGKSDPRNMLHSGQAFVTSGGHPVETAAGLQAGDRIDLMLHDGTVSCTVREVSLFGQT